jgi:hypothetical protein
MVQGEDRATAERDVRLAGETGSACTADCRDRRAGKRRRVMRSIGRLGRGLVALAFVMGVMAAVAAPSTQAVTKYARVTFHVAECPQNTGDVFGKCHDDRVADFGIWGCSPTGYCKLKNTDDDGVVFFGPRAGSNRFFVDSLKGYVGTRPYCSVQNDDAVLIDRRDADGDFTISTHRGDVIICDLYLLTDN